MILCTIKNKNNLQIIKILRYIITFMFECNLYASIRVTIQRNNIPLNEIVTNLFFVNVQASN